MSGAPSKPSHQWLWYAGPPGPFTSKKLSKEALSADPPPAKVASTIRKVATVDDPDCRPICRRSRRSPGARAWGGADHGRQRVVGARSSLVRKAAAQAKRLDGSTRAGEGGGKRSWGSPAVLRGCGSSHLEVCADIHHVQQFTHPAAPRTPITTSGASAIAAAAAHAATANTDSATAVAVAPAEAGGGSPLGRKLQRR